MTHGSFRLTRCSISALLGLGLLAACGVRDAKQTADEARRDAENALDEAMMDADPLDGDDGDGQDAPAPREACAKYIECARGATPTSVTPLIATYGAEGSCWDLPGVSEA